MTPLALHLTHPTGGTWQVELVLAKPLVLSREGSVQLGHEHTDVDPELLIFDPAPVNFRLKGERRWGGIKAPQLVDLNGDSVERGVVKAGDVLRWWDFVVSVVEVGPLSETERAMIDAARSSDAALQVYADWLESNGAGQRAEWARLMLTWKPEAASALAQRVGASFRALVARAPIERCEARCGQRWESLPLSSKPLNRECSRCGRTVMWCAEASVARALRDQPVVLDRAAPRTSGDLVRSPYVIG